jgi:hypothetical protein
VRCSAFQVSVSFVITGPESPAELPRNWPSAGTKSPLESPCRYSSGSTSLIFGVLRHHGGKIAEENLARCPVSGSTRRSLTRGAVTSTAPAEVSTLPGLVRTVAHDQPAAVLVALVDVARDVVLDLGLQRLGQRPSGTLADQLVDQRRRAVPAGVISVASSRNYGEHGSYPSDQRGMAGLA